MTAASATESTADLDALWLDRAVRAAVRAHGAVSPNPLVGCIVLDANGALAGIGHHRRCGGPHAEIDALSVSGDAVRGGTVYVTLEPCAHHGRTGPCADALIEARPHRVVIGTRDPHEVSAGGLERLCSAGIDVSCIDHGPSIALTAPFLRRTTTGLPWITAKWAQSLDGHLAPATGSGPVSTPRSRRLVHRERGRVDAVLTGIGTVLADDPLLTPRDVRVRRMPVRIVIDPRGRTPLESALVTSARSGPVLVVVGEDVETSALAACGVEIVTAPVDDAGRMCLRDVLVGLAARHDIQTILTEAGPTLLSYLFDEELVSEVAVFVSPQTLTDGMAPAPIDVLGAPPAWLDLRSVHQRDGDMLMRYGVTAKSAGDTGT